MFVHLGFRLELELVLVFLTEAVNRGGRTSIVPLKCFCNSHTSANERALMGVTQLLMVINVLVDLLTKELDGSQSI